MNVNEEYGLCYFWKIISEFFICSYIFLLLCKILFIYIFPLFIVTFGAVTIFDQAFVKSISSDRVNFYCVFLRGQKLCWGRNVVVWTTRILIGLDSSVVEHLTSDAGVSGWKSRSSHTYSFVFFSIFDECISVYMSIPPIPTSAFC